MNENNIARNRWMAIAFGALACITLIAFVYAFLQQAEAKRQAELAVECQMKSMEMVKQIELQRQQAEQALDRAQDALRYAEAMRLKSESDLKKK
jgi:Flp pilus assembly protein TadB